MDGIIYALTLAAIIVGIGVFCEISARLWDRLTLPQYRRRFAPRRHPSAGRATHPWKAAR